MSVIIDEYSELLLQQFAAEKSRLMNILPTSSVVEHVGSSAVGIGGKNIVDILVGVDSADEIENIRDILVKNGYFEGQDSHRNRVFLASRQEETSQGDFHIHICPVGSESFRDFISLRDFLRKNPRKAQAYLKKKQQFAAEANFERRRYKALKSTYLSKLIAEAKKEL